MGKLFFIFFTTIILLITIDRERQNYLTPLFIKAKNSSEIDQFARDRVSQFKDPKMKALALSYVFGINKDLNKEEKDLHQKLNLKHLFSPSGLHLSSVLVWILWMRKKGWKKAKLVLWSIIMALCLSSLELTGYFPLKRTLWFQFLVLSLDFLAPKYFNKPSSFALFLATMAIDFLFGSYDEASLSFTYSFLFWGIILTQNNFIKRLFFLSLGQLLVAYFAHYLVNPLSFLANAILGPIFTMLFPFIFFSLFTPWIFIAENTLRFFQTIMEFTANKIDFFPQISVKEFYLYFLMTLLIYMTFKVPKKTFVVLLLVSIPLKEIDESLAKELIHAYSSKKKSHPKVALKRNLKI
ncbi:MAG: ComEC/Rec2 family competence protein [Bacteriovoracaceae bacterium]